MDTLRSTDNLESCNHHQEDNNICHNVNELEVVILAILFIFLH